jgi:plasmid maintenance system antidote protein VapI
MTAFADTIHKSSAAPVDSGGTMWRLRSLVAMGHDATRIARALGLHPQTVQEILRGDADTVSSRLREHTGRLWDAWWDKRPPEQTASQRHAAAAARQQAERLGWCPPLGLDEDELDEPGYRPYSRYRAAAGTGTAGEFRP